MSDATSCHRFAIEYFDRDGRRLGQVPVAPDFQPAREWARFAAVRRGLAPPLTAPAAGEVQPLWRDDVGPPYCRGVRVVDDGAAEPADPRAELPIEYFRELAVENAAVYVERGELEAGDAYRYRICAYPVEDAAPISAAEEDPLAGIRVDAAADPIALVDSCLAEFEAAAEPVASAAPAGPPDSADMPAFLDAAVLEQTRALAERAGALETGGVLVGRLHRDRARPEVFAEITAQIPARHASAGRASFAFTPESWAAAEAAIALRGAGELILGWWHSHPRFCARCPEERWRSCALARPFFSPDDVHLQRTCFPQAYQLALLVSDLPDAGPTPALFGWRAGKVAPRGYGVVRPADDSPSPRSHP